MNLSENATQTQDTQDMQDETQEQSLALRIEQSLTLYGMEEVDSTKVATLESDMTPAQTSEAAEWVDDMLAERDASENGERKPNWPTIPEFLESMVKVSSESSGDSDESESGVTESEQPSDEPKPSDRPKAETRPEAVKRLHQSIHVLRQRLLDAFGEHADLTEQVKIAKKHLERVQGKLNEAVADLDSALFSKDWQPGLPFNETDDDDDDDDDDESSGSDEQPSRDTPSQTKDPAIDASIEQLGLTESMTEKLFNAYIDTIADLEKSMREDKLRKAKGVGPGAIDKITDALIAWRNQNGYGCTEDDEPEDQPAEGDSQSEADSETETEEGESVPARDVESSGQESSGDETDQGEGEVADDQRRDD